MLRDIWVVSYVIVCSFCWKICRLMYHFYLFSFLSIPWNPLRKNIILPIHFHSFPLIDISWYRYFHFLLLYFVLSYSFPFLQLLQDEILFLPLNFIHSHFIPVPFLRKEHTLYRSLRLISTKKYINNLNIVDVCLKYNVVL